jgi:hypothetical protein
MTKIIVRITIAKEEILVPDCEWPSRWNNYSKMIIVVVMRIMRFLLIIISFPIVSFFVDGYFENIGIVF